MSMQSIHAHILYIISKYMYMRTCKNVPHLHIHMCIPDMYLTVHVPFLRQDITVAGVDNNISQTLLQISYVTSRLKRLQQTLEEQKEAFQQQNKLISHSDAEITRHNALIERKRTQIDQLNKKIDQKLSKIEGVSGTAVVLIQ